MKIANHSSSDGENLPSLRHKQIRDKLGHITYMVGAVTPVRIGSVLKIHRKILSFFEIQPPVKNRPNK